VSRRIRSEDGFTVIMAMVVMLVGLLFATAAIGQALSTESSVRRDGESKAALQAARAGVETSRYRMTALAEGVTAPNGSPLCPSVDASNNVTFVAPTLTAGGKPWCPPVTMQVGAGETSTTWVSSDTDTASKMTDARDIVSSGVAADGRRRVRTSWMVFDIRRLFLDYTVFSKETLNLENSGEIGAPEVQGNARSNGSILLNHPATRIYGNATPGPGADDVVNSPVQVTKSTTKATEDLVLPPVDTTEARAVNDNAELCGGTCPADLRFDLSETRTILGNTYLVCSIAFSGQGNPTIRFAPRDESQPIRIFIESPERCGGTGGMVFEVGNKPTLEVASTEFPSLQIFVAGSPTIGTTALISNNNSSPYLPITLYAPNTSVTVDNHSTVNGGIAAKQVTMSNNSQIVQYSQPTSLDLEIPPKITGGEFVECTADVPQGASLTDGC
jgi:type II secretory pathway pseudopilin PulG